MPLSRQPGAHLSPSLRAFNLSANRCRRSQCPVAVPGCTSVALQSARAVKLYHSARHSVLPLGTDSETRLSGCHEQLLMMRSGTFATEANNSRLLLWIEFSTLRTLAPRCTT
jgi:hypothetical protein